MNEVLKEIGAFFFFLTLLMSVVQTHRDSNTFLLTKTLTETFEEVDAFAINLDAVSVLEYLKEELLLGRVQCTQNTPYAKNITPCIFATISEPCTVFWLNYLDDRTKNMQN